jgi:YesN/AraC family two-component response regulator
MIIDDEKSVVSGLIEHIPWSELGLKVTQTAGDGQEALEKIRSEQPDIVITDVYMPKMDGLTLIQHLREEFPDIYIVIHSGYDEFDNARIAMRYGVQYFLLKPSMVAEITSVLQEVMQEIDVQEKRQQLQARFEAEQQTYLHYMQDAFIREMLETRYKEQDFPVEKLKLLRLDRNTPVVAATISLIRPPYLTKSKEREWQLIKYGSSNIVREMIQEAQEDSLAIHLVEYSDSKLVLVFFAKQPDLDLLEVSKRMTAGMIDNILRYLKLSLSVGIGEIKRGVHELIDSYLESLQALEAADYHAVNRVYTYREVHSSDELVECRYPYSLLKDVYQAIDEQEIGRLIEIWERAEQELLSDQRLPIYIIQNLCISLVGILMTVSEDKRNMQTHMNTLSVKFSEIYALASAKELCAWMRGWLMDWVKRSEAQSGRKTSRLVQEVKQYVRHHYDQEITLTEIADKLYVNRNYLSQLFKRVTGESFVTYLNKFRIEKAKERMREKHYLISEISEMVGYQNPTYFSQVFKSITGKSPSEFYK